MARDRCRLVASLGFVVASAFGSGRALAQGGDPDDGSELGPDRREVDEARREALKSHLPQPAQRRKPSPPDGPDQDPDGGRGGAQCETAVALDPNDEQHAVAVAVDLASGSALTRWYTTLDGGQTWKTGTIKNESGYIFNGDCAVVITPNGIPVIITLQYFGAGGSAIYAYRSLDGGLTWQAGLSIDLDPANDKVQAATDLSGGPHHGQIACAWDRFFTAQGDTIHAAVSDDDGVSFQHVQRVDDANGHANISPDVAYGPNSDLWITWADRGRFDILVDRSTDGGRTWQADINAGNYIQVPASIPGSFFRIFDIFSIAVDWTGGPHSGNVYVLYHRWQSAAPQNADVVCLRSEDNGATWKKSNVNAGDTTQADQVMPFAQVDPHGNVNVAFYDRRLDPNNFLLWTWVARSSDGGKNWREFAASDVGWDHATSDSPGYIGDYLGLDSSNHTSRPFYADGRTGTIDVGTDELHLDLYTDVDQLSAATGGVVNFSLNVGPNEAGTNYWLVGSLATTPGLDFGKVHLPLNYDAFFQLTIQLTNSPVLSNSAGTLDATGSATITLDTLGPFAPSLAGTDLFFAAYIYHPRAIYGSNATTVSLVP